MTSILINWAHISDHWKKLTTFGLLHFIQQQHGWQHTTDQLLRDWRRFGQLLADRRSILMEKSRFLDTWWLGIVQSCTKIYINENIAQCLPLGIKKGMVANIDHNHQTGEVRKLLCRMCNFLLGFVQENIQRLATVIQYLYKYNHLGDEWIM